jgi:hypothetical protein
VRKRATSHRQIRRARRELRRLRRAAEDRSIGCAFCGDEPTVERLHGETAVMGYFGPEGIVAVPGELAACLPCAELLDREDVDGLVDRSLEKIAAAWPGDDPLPPRWFSEAAARLLAKGYLARRDAV